MVVKKATKKKLTKKANVLNTATTNYSYSGAKVNDIYLGKTARTVAPVAPNPLPLYEGQSSTMPGAFPSSSSSGRTSTVKPKTRVVKKPVLRDTTNVMVSNTMPAPLIQKTQTPAVASSSMNNENQAPSAIMKKTPKKFERPVNNVPVTPKTTLKKAPVIPKAQQRAIDTNSFSVTQIKKPEIPIIPIPRIKAAEKAVGEDPIAAAKYVAETIVLKGGTKRKIEAVDTETITTIKKRKTQHDTKPIDSIIGKRSSQTTTSKPAKKQKTVDTRTVPTVTGKRKADGTLTAKTTKKAKTTDTRLAAGSILGKQKPAETLTSKTPKKQKTVDTRIVKSVLGKRTGGTLASKTVKKAKQVDTRELRPQVTKRKAESKLPIAVKKSKVTATTKDGKVVAKTKRLLKMV